MKPPFRPFPKARRLLCVVGFLLCCVAHITRGADMKAVEGVAVFSATSEDGSYYILMDFSQISSLAVLQDTAGLASGHAGLPSRYLCNDTGMVSNGLPVLLVQRAMPSSISIPAVARFYAQGPGVASGEGHTVVASDTHSDPDMDSDGVPSSFESANASNPAQANSDADADGDGHSLLWEYWAGTDPQNPLSALRLTATPSPPPSTHLSLSWPSVSGKRYEVQAAGELGGPFGTLSNVTATGSSSLIQLPAGNSANFYRLILKP